ncbi:MAG TPA: cyanophycin synthetase [Vicinamibacterales bacterium]|nr:cyanophycin synthetase [Vicinamibacterales bacterium]
MPEPSIPPPLDPDDPLGYLFSLERLGMKFGLENITGVCAALGNPQHAFHNVLIAGTNGKGSVTAMVERGLRAAGHRTGRYTSPHLVRLEERFLIDGREVATDRLRDAARRVRSAVTSPPTFFEFATAAAFVLFQEAAIEIAVLEVGLGGRLDATNVVNPMATAITSIDFDHQAQLGDTLAAIAGEKAGIVRPSVPLICGPLPAEAEQVIRAVCLEADAPLVMAPADLQPPFDDAPLALRGRHQRTNAAVALELLRAIDERGVRVDAAAMRAAIGGVEWPGRLEELPGPHDARVLLDAAHNPAGARALATSLLDMGWQDAALILGCVRDKDVPAILAELLPQTTGAIICTEPHTPRALGATELARLARHSAPARQIDHDADPARALHRACAVHPRVVVAGSIFLVGPLRGILRKS